MNFWSDSVRQNNHCAARVAMKSYLVDAVAHAAQRRIFEEEMKDEGFHTYWWSNRSAAGVVIHGQRGTAIGVAGTNDRDDARADVHLTRTRLDVDWATINSVQLCRDVLQSPVHTTAGFAGYAALASAGIQRCLVDNHIVLRNNVALCGHSLGGACVQLLQLFEPYCSATSYTFGGARAFRRSSHVPARMRFATMRLSDPVIYQPAFVCKQADAQRLYVCRTGLRSTIPTHVLPLVAAINAASWSVGILNLGLDLLRVPRPAWMRLGIDDGHKMAGYVRDTE